MAKKVRVNVAQIENVTVELVVRDDATEEEVLDAAPSYAQFSQYLSCADHIASTYEIVEEGIDTCAWDLVEV